MRLLGPGHKLFEDMLFVIAAGSKRAAKMQWSPALYPEGCSNKTVQGTENRMEWRKE